VSKKTGKALTPFKKTKPCEVPQNGHLPRGDQSSMAVLERKEPTEKEKRPESLLDKQKKKLLRCGLEPQIFI